MNLAVADEPGLRVEWSYSYGFDHILYTWQDFLVRRRQGAKMGAPTVVGAYHGSKKQKMLCSG
jgi:hypothetical protein